jgi:hypothetical protein
MHGWARLFEKLLEVIGGLPCLMLEIALSSSNELIVGVVNLCVISTLMATGSDHDLLGSPLWPPLDAFGSPLRTLADCLKGHPLTTIRGYLPVTLAENRSDCLLARGVPCGDVKHLLRGL